MSQLELAGFKIQQILNDESVRWRRRRRREGKPNTLKAFIPAKKISSRTHLQKIVADHLSISPFLIAEVAQRRHPWGKNWGGWIFWQDAPHLGQKSFSTNKTIFFFTVSIFLSSGSSIDQFPDWFSVFFLDPMVSADGWEARLSKKDLGRWSFSSFWSSNEKLRTHHWSHSSSVFTSRVGWN